MIFVPYIARKQRLQLRSISKRLKESNATIGLDRDGVINKEPTKLSARDLAKIGLGKPSKYVDKVEHFLFKPTAKQALRNLHNSGFHIFLATGKAGIGRGVQKPGEIKRPHWFMQKEISPNKHDPVIGTILVATDGGNPKEPDNPDKQNKVVVGFNPKYLVCKPSIAFKKPKSGYGYAPTIFLKGPDAKKPNTAMFKVAQAKLGFEPSRTFYIGDEESDVKAGKSYGCPTILIGSKKNWPAGKAQPDYFARDLSEASKIAIAAVLGRRKLRVRN